MGVQKLVRDPKEMVESGGHKASFQSTPDWPRLRGASPRSPFAAQAIWRAGNFFPQDGKILYRQTEKKKIT